MIQLPEREWKGRMGVEESDVRGAGLEAKNNGSLSFYFAGTRVWKREVGAYSGRECICMVIAGRWEDFVAVYIYSCLYR